MAKWFGKVGYADVVETSPGVWKDSIVEHEHFGDTEKNWNRSLQNSGEVNDNLILNTNISIVADPYAITNFSKIKYVEFMGANWKVTNAEVRFPRILLSMGGLYNG